MTREQNSVDAELCHALASCLDDAPPIPNVIRRFACGEFDGYKIEDPREIFREPAIEWMRNPIHV